MVAFSILRNIKGKLETRKAKNALDDISKAVRDGSELEVIKNDILTIIIKARGIVENSTLCAKEVTL